MTLIDNLISGTDCRPLCQEEIEKLERQGCSANDWNDVWIHPDLNLKNIKNVFFSARIKIGKHSILRNIPGGIGNCIVADNVRIENVARIEFEPEATCGVGLTISVLDETGSRPVYIFPGLSSQIAELMAREPKWVTNNLFEHLSEFLEKKEVTPMISEGAVVMDCGRLVNVFIDREVKIEGARNLKNGSIINNAMTGKALAYVGNGVDAENFILEDGRLDSGVIVRNCYIGQGAELSNGFTAHDSLFFANCVFENGEACALFAGPYTVSKHKGSLLIGCLTSFMNAGSATNQSNHMYKLGPVHWGVLQRGVKTASGAYLMLGAKIGPFSLLSGQHKTHPDSSSFPFSYLFGDDRGATVVVPGAMLRSCGLLRDEQKWPTRDTRQKRKLSVNDRIIFNVLNPYTVDSMLNAIETISELLSKPIDDDLFIRYKGMKFSRSSLERARNLYRLGIFKYLSITLPGYKFPEKNGLKPDVWTDVGGQILTRSTLNEILDTTSIDDAENLFNFAYENYHKMELEWIGNRFDDWWRSMESQIKAQAEIFDSMIEEDKGEYLDKLLQENKMLTL